MHRGKRDLPFRVIAQRTQVVQAGVMQLRTLKPEGYESSYCNYSDHPPINFLPTHPLLSLSCIFELFPGLLEADPVCVAYLLAELAHLRICGKAKEAGTQNCRVYCNVYFYYYSRITTREAI